MYCHLPNQVSAPPPFDKITWFWALLCLKSLCVSLTSFLLFRGIPGVWWLQMCKENIWFFGPKFESWLHTHMAKIFIAESWSPPRFDLGPGKSDQFRSVKTTDPVWSCWKWVLQPLLLVHTCSDQFNIFFGYVAVESGSHQNDHSLNRFPSVYLLFSSLLLLLGTDPSRFPNLDWSQLMLQSQTHLPVVTKAKILFYIQQNL
jgi:hypothetical protein